MKLEEGGVLDFDNSERFIPEHKNLESVDNKWILEPGGYLVRYNEIIKVPLNAIGMVLPRSTLMRIGGTICSAVWDPGYNGRGIGLLIVNTKMTIHKGARIAQIVFIKTQEKLVEGYSGTYQNEDVNE
jgi:dUTP pyrophosphatase